MSGLNFDFLAGDFGCHLQSGVGNTYFIGGIMKIKSTTAHKVFNAMPGF